VFPGTSTVGRQAGTQIIIAFGGRPRCLGTGQATLHRETVLELSEHGKGGGHFLDHRP